MVKTRAMKFGKILGTLLVLNLAMVVYLVIIVTRGPMDLSSFQASGDAAVLPGKTGVAPVDAAVVYVTNQFHWSQLESEDYRSYIETYRLVYRSHGRQYHGGCRRWTI